MLPLKPYFRLVTSKQTQLHQLLPTSEVSKVLKGYNPLKIIIFNYSMNTIW